MISKKLQQAIKNHPGFLAFRGASVKTHEPSKSAEGGKNKQGGEQGKG